MHNKWNRCETTQKMPVNFLELLLNKSKSVSLIQKLFLVKIDYISRNYCTLLIFPASSLTWIVAAVSLWGWWVQILRPPYRYEMHFLCCRAHTISYVHICTRIFIRPMSWPNVTISWTIAASSKSDIKWSFRNWMYLALFNLISVLTALFEWQFFMYN